MRDEWKYELIRSGRKTISIEVKEDGRVVVRAPWHISEVKIKRFVEEKESWILKAQEKVRMKSQNRAQIQKIPPEQRQILARKAGEMLVERTRFFAEKMGVIYGRITIREQKTRWGSCSSKKNLNFNWKLILAPPEVLDYVVVHELCHLKQMNHSPAFWAEVKKVLPDYEQRKRWLRDHGTELMEA